MLFHSTKMGLEIENLSIQFQGQSQAAVRNVNCTVPKGGCLGIVGESGSGKSLTALCILQLLPSSARVAERSRIVFNGEDLLAMSERRMQTLRGHKIGIVFQDALTALNPVATIGQQLCEVIRARAKKKRAYQLLDEVGISSVVQCYRSYPHQLSVGTAAINCRV